MNLESQQPQQQVQEQQAQQQSQQQNQDYASQYCDPTQVQSYYSYYQQYPQHPQHEQHYAYYQPEYAIAYQQQQQQQPEQVAVNPPGVSVSKEAAQVVDAGGAGGLTVAVGPWQGQVQVLQQQQQHNAHYPGGGEQHGSGYPVPPGLNPAAAAAVAALSQLTQFAGTMGVAERAMAGLHAKVAGFGPMMGQGLMHHGLGPMHPRVGPSPYWGGGRRGGGPFRGGGRGNFGRHHPRSAGPYFRGRGRGMGRGAHRRFPRHVASSSSHPESSSGEDSESTDEEAELSADEAEEAAAVHPKQSLSTAASGKVVPNRQTRRVACELCRVDCNSLEILEQHKNGKRHKKNLQRIEELKNATKPGVDTQNEQKPIAESKPELSREPEIAQGGKENKPEENLPAEATTNKDEIENERQNNSEEQSEVPLQESYNLQARKPMMDRSDNWRHGMKRKMGGGRGGNHMKTFESPRRMEPSKPKVLIPLICNICNVKCDTQEVLDRHLSGKKHIAKLKRFEGHQAMYGPAGLQALYPPNPIAQTLFLPQGLQRSFYGPQGSHPPPEAYMPSQAHQAAPTAAGIDLQFQQNPMPQGSETTLESGGQSSVTIAPMAQQQVAPVNPELKPAVAVEANLVNSISEPGGKGSNSLQHATHDTSSLPDYCVAAYAVFSSCPDEGPSE